MKAIPDSSICQAWPTTYQLLREMPLPGIPNVTRFSNCIFFKTNVNWHYATTSENRISHMLTDLAPKE